MPTYTWATAHYHPKPINMLRLTIALTLAAVASAWLSGCAEQPLEAVKAEVDSRLEYQAYEARDYRVVAKGPGNCAVYAATYQAAAARRGIPGRIYTCLLQDGQGHAFYQAASGQVLDLRQAGVNTLDGVGCVKGSVRLAK